VLAVLAFDNRSNDPEMDFFSDGVAEEIHQTLARSSELKVIARSSSFQFRGADKAVSQVASKLAISHLLDGSVRRGGARVRVSAHLVECASEVILWSERFDRELDDIFAVQDEIAADVAAALKLALAPKPSLQGVVTPAGYDSFLRAQAMLFGHERGDLAHAEAMQTVVELLEGVTGEAPSFARAWGLLASARSANLRAGRSSQPFRVARAEVIAAGETALRLDPGRSEASVALANLEPWGALAARERPLLKALELAPNDPVLLMYLGNFYANTGLRREALMFSDRARTLDPMLPAAQARYAGHLMELGRAEEGWAIYEDVCRRWPQFVAEAVAWSASLHDWERFDRYAAEGSAGPAAKLPMFGALLLYGQQLRAPNPDLAAAYLAGVSAQVDETGHIGLDAFCSLDDFGLTDAAFDLVERASFAHMFDPAGHHPGGGYGVSILFTGLNGAREQDPRFARLCARLGLCDFWVASDRWPDFVDAAPFDFRAEARRLVAEGVSGR
jgi:TolB-like protein